MYRKSLFIVFDCEIHRSNSSELILGLFGPMYVRTGKDLSERTLRHTVVLCHPSRAAASPIVINMHGTC